MPKQVGEYRFIGTIDGLCFYTMEGNYYARKQSSLTGKRFWKAACFEASRRSCRRLAKGSRLAAMVYAKCRKQKGLYAALKSKAIALLKKNKSEEKVVRMLVKLASFIQPSQLHAVPFTATKTKTNSVARLFYIIPITERIDFFNRYLSSA